MGLYVAGEIVKLMTEQAHSRQRRAHPGAGATFKENCPDIRNSKVFDVVRELREIRREGRYLRSLGGRASAGTNTACGLKTLKPGLTMWR